MIIKKLLTSKNVPFKEAVDNGKIFKCMFSNQLSFERGVKALEAAGHVIKAETRNLDGWGVAGDCAAFDVHATDPARLKAEVKKDLTKE